jgi:hypothetical protein
METWPWITVSTRKGTFDERRESTGQHKFQQELQILKDRADWLSSQKEPDIDQLMPKVEKAMGAYKICKHPLDKVQATLGQYFQKNGTPESDAADNGKGLAKKAL